MLAAKERVGATLAFLKDYLTGGLFPVTLGSTDWHNLIDDQRVPSIHQQHENLESFAEQIKAIAQKYGCIAEIVSEIIEPLEPNFPGTWLPHEGTLVQEKIQLVPRTHKRTAEFVDALMEIHSTFSHQDSTTIGRFEDMYCQAQVNIVSAIAKRSPHKTTH